MVNEIFHTIFDNFIIYNHIIIIIIIINNQSRILKCYLEYGPAIIDHVLSKCGLTGTLRLVSNRDEKGFHIERDMTMLKNALDMAEQMLVTAAKTISKVY